MLVSVSTHLWKDILVVYTFWAMKNEVAKKINLQSRSSYGLASFILEANIKPKSLMLAEWGGAGTLHFVRGFKQASSACLGLCIPPAGKSIPAARWPQQHSVSLACVPKQKPSHIHGFLSAHTFLKYQVFIVEIFTMHV